MINFYCLQIDNPNCEPNVWHAYDSKRHYFKLPVSFQGHSTGANVKVKDLFANQNHPLIGYFMPSEYYMHFITDFSNNSIELMSNLYASNDVVVEEQGPLLTYYYIIPWYHIPKNYLDFQPKHILMMSNMSYLMDMNPNNNQATNLYYDKYYNGIDILTSDIETAYAKFMMDKFSLDHIIVKDYLNF